MSREGERIMMAQGSFLLGGIFLVINGAMGRAIPDFYTDEDLNAWHKFGLRSFYGPWSVIARKPNGDFVSYTDYGARVPSDFRPVSSSATMEVDSLADFSQRQFASAYVAGMADSATGFGRPPYDGAALAAPADLSALLPNDLFDEKKFSTRTDDRESVEGTTTDETGNGEKKRDTLELIGIVGVISDDDDSTENDGTTTSNSAVGNTTELEADDYGSSTSERNGV